MLTHERLTAWQKAHEFTLAVLRAFERAPKAAHPTLVHQLQRAAIAVSTGIVEGAVRVTADGFAAELDASLAAARECRYLIRLASDLGTITSPGRATLEARCDQVCRLLASLRRHVEGSAAARRTGHVRRARRAPPRES